MSLAWEITEDDVKVVLGLHFDRWPLPCVQIDAKAVFQQHFDDAACDRVEKAVLCYTDFDDQSDAAMNEIEDILIEARIITEEKLYKSP
jgi:hypothetical protein